MSDLNQDFADAAVAAMSKQEESGAPSAEGGTEPSGEVDPVLEYAKALQASGLTPDQAREAHQRLAYISTPQGQQQYFEAFIASDQGQFLKERFGREYTANMLATNPEKVYAMAKEFGYTPPQDSADADEDGMPETREMKSIKAQQSALEARMKQLAEGANQEIQALKGQLRGREDAEGKRDVFVDWTKTQPPMAQKAYAAIAKRAHELSALYPHQYPGAQGFRKAASDALGEISNTAQFFQPKQRPRNGATGGGGVAGAPVDDSKLTLEQRIESLAGQYAEDARNGRGGD